MRTASFQNLPLGARIKYAPDHPMTWTIIRIVQHKVDGMRHGTLAEYKPEMYDYGWWPGQAMAGHIPIEEGGDCPDLVYIAE